jgi:hypothetical protein
MSKKKMYELDVTKVFYWQETNDNNYVFHKQKTPFKLYLTKYGNKNQYMDLITGIVFIIEAKENSIILLPSGIVLSKENLQEAENVILKTIRIINNEEILKKYMSTSKGILLYSYFSSVISCEYTEDDEINMYRRRYEN